MGLKVWLPLNDDLHNQGCSNVTVTNNGATVNTNGKIGSCYAFNGSSNYMYTSYNFYNSQYSVCAWIYTTTATATQTIVCDRKTVGYGFSIFLLNSGLLRLDPGCNNTNLQWTTSYSYPINTWFHLTITYDGTDVAYYINGEFKEKIARSITNTYWGTTTSIGASQANGSGYGNYLKGRLNDVRIYDHCLSAAEVREISQGLVLHYKLDDITNGIQDSSGYGHNGSINSNLTLSSITPRYQYSMSFDGVDDCIIVPYNTICPENIFTFNLWFKKDTLGSKNYETLFGGPSHFEMDTRSGSATALSLYMTSTRSGKRNLVTELSLGNWYMVTMTRDGTKEKYYINGIFQSEINAKAMPTGVYRIGAWASNTGQNYYGLISDFRIYCTALDADAIRQLYEVGAKVDNKGNFHTFEVNENGSNKLTKTGILKDYIVEPFLTLSDGSKWQLLLYHYVDGGTNLFTQAKAPYCNEFGLYSRLQYADNFTYDNKYEFYVLQDDIEYRWTQTNKPTATSPSGFTAISGYTNAVQGLVKPTNLTKAYFGYNTWWGACGSWTSYSTGGKTGIPGFGTHNAAGMCTKYLALYARVSDFNAKIANLSALANHFIEI